MQKTTHKNNFIILLIVAIPLIFTAISYFTILIFCTNYSKYNHNKIFSVILNRSMPHSLKNTIVRGHGFAGGQQVWMYFESDSATINYIISGRIELSKSDFRAMDTKIPVSHFGFGLSAWLHKDAYEAKWQNIKSIRHPKYYLLSANDADGQGWYGVIVVDTELNRVYVSAQG